MSVIRFSRKRRHADLARMAARRMLEGASVAALAVEYEVSRDAIYQAKHRLRRAELRSTPEDELTD